MVPLVVLVLVVVAVGWFTAASSQLFFVSVRNGKCLIVRGTLPVSLMQDFREIVASPPIRRGTIRAYKGEHGAELRFGGDIDAGREQRMRNCFMLFPAAKLRAAPRQSKETLGQLAGIAWLAWMLDRR